MPTSSLADIWLEVEPSTGKWGGAAQADVALHNQGGKQVQLVLWDSRPLLLSCLCYICREGLYHLTMIGWRTTQSGRGCGLFPEPAGRAGWKSWIPFCTHAWERGNTKSDCTGTSVCAQSCLTLCDPMDCSPPDSSVHGILQARILEPVTISYSRQSSWPREQTHVICIGRQILYHYATWEAHGCQSSPLIFGASIVLWATLVA